MPWRDAINAHAGILMKTGESRSLVLARWFALGAGVLDFGSGLGLAVAPARAMPLMRLPVPDAASLVWVRWVGAFVCAVGATYLLAAILGGAARLRALLELTLPLRASVFVFGTAAILAGALPSAWAGVPATDLAFVVVQVALLRAFARLE